MSIIDFNSAIWSDPWFRKLLPTAKILFIYLWTNSHKNLCGIYPLDTETMQFDTGLNKKQIKDTLSILYPKVLYDDTREIVFIVNHVRHQFLRTEKVSPKIVVGIRKCLILLNKHPFIGNFLEEYNSILKIDYPYPIEGVHLYPSSEGKGEEEGKGGGEDKGVYGQFKNVLLTKVEYEKLQSKFNSSTNNRIESMSEYIESKGIKYKSHYATILSWQRMEEKQNKQAEGTPNMYDQI